MYYMLDGLAKTWKPVYNNEITYQYLPPGDYTLKLKALNGDAVESKKITTLQIQVDPPFLENMVVQDSTCTIHCCTIILVRSSAYETQRIDNENAQQYCGWPAP